MDGGGGGSRTRVLDRHYADLYMLVPALLLIVLWICRRTGARRTMRSAFSQKTPEPRAFCQDTDLVSVP